MLKMALTSFSKTFAEKGGGGGGGGGGNGPTAPSRLNTELFFLITLLSRVLSITKSLVSYTGKLLSLVCFCFPHSLILVVWFHLL